AIAVRRRLHRTCDECPQQIPEEVPTWRRSTIVSAPNPLAPATSRRGGERAPRTIFTPRWLAKAPRPNLLHPGETRLPKIPPASRAPEKSKGSPTSIQPTP